MKKIKIDELTEEHITIINDLLKIIEWYGSSFDSQGWEVEERFEAVAQIFNMFYFKSPPRIYGCSSNKKNFKP
jgi:hypothetical protein